MNVERTMGLRSESLRCTGIFWVFRSTRPRILIETYS